MEAAGFADRVPPLPAQAACFSENLQLLVKRYILGCSEVGPEVIFPEEFHCKGYTHLSHPTQELTLGTLWVHKELTGLKWGQEEEEINIHRTRP